MSALEIVLAIISVVSFGLAVFSFVRTEIKKANERAKFEVMREKIGYLERTFIGLFNAVDHIVQESKISDATPRELGNMSRLVRGNIGVLIGGIRKYRIRLDNWRFGAMIPSDKVYEAEPDIPGADEKAPQEAQADRD